jgi:hypothetical protein
LRTIPLVVVVFAFVLSACQESTVGPSAASRELATEGEVMLGTVEGLTMSSADVVAGFNCAVGIFGGYPRVFTTDSHITKSNGGKMTLTCHGLLPEGVGPTLRGLSGPQVPRVLYDCHAVATGVYSFWRDQPEVPGEVGFQRRNTR